jgi:hypothetical protein
MTAPAKLALSDFLLARIADDEARLLSRPLWMRGSYLDGFSPSRLESECRAKRQIVEFLAERSEFEEGDTYDLGVWRGLDQAARLLALPYAAHPDYDEAWRP